MYVWARPDRARPQRPVLLRPYDAAQGADGAHVNGHSIKGYSGNTINGGRTPLAPH